MIWCLLFYFTFILERSAANSEGYKMYDFATWCPRDSGKLSIPLKTGTAIFTIDERNQVTANILKSRDISCHLELETHNTDYGFHVFFDEMNLDETDDSILEGPKPTTCRDYVQFGRDVLYITTSKSRKFCGYRERLFYHNATQADYARASRQGSRLFIESSDHEMDLWLLVKRNKNRTKKSKRNIRLIVTVFKKVCKSNDLYWRKCDNTDYCVRKGYWCDNYANCGWPDGEIATDETTKLCAEVWRKNSESANQIATFFSPSNIPVIIIVAIVITAIFVILVIGIVRFVRAIRSNAPNTNEDGSSSGSMQASSSGNSSRRDNRRTTPEARTRALVSTDQRAPRGRSILSSVDAEVTPALLHHTDPGDGLPSAPPSYEEVVQSPYVPSAPIADRSDPPPYSANLI